MYNIWKTLFAIYDFLIAEINNIVVYGLVLNDRIIAVKHGLCAARSD